MLEFIYTVWEKDIHTCLEYFLNFLYTHSIFFPWEFFSICFFGNILLWDFYFIKQNILTLSTWKLDLYLW